MINLIKFHDSLFGFKDLIFNAYYLARHLFVLKTKVWFLRLKIIVYFQKTDRDLRLNAFI